MTIRSFSAPRSAAFVVACLSATFAPPALAERITLEPMVVVATRYPAPVAQTPAAVTVLEAGDLVADAARPLEEILLMRAGISVGRAGGPGQQTSVFLRGNESDGVLVLVDGLRLNGATFDGANLQNLRGADIARIEIVRGPRSTLYGSEAIGGVISITTRRDGAGESGDASAAGNDRVVLRGESGSDGTAQAHAAFTRRIADHHVAFSAGHTRTDGDRLIDSLAVEGAHDNTSHTFNASTRFDDTRIGIDALASEGTTRYADTFAGTALHQDFRNRAASLWSETALGEQLRLDARVGRVGDLIAQQESADFARTERLSGQLSLRAAGDANVLVVGIDAEREEAHALIYGLTTREAADNRALFARNEFTLGAQQITLGARETDYDSFGRQTTGEAAYGYAFHRDTFAWLAAGRGFHAPNSVDRYGYGGNPALQPETGDSLEAGVRQRLGAWQLTLTGFRQDIEQLMLCVALPPPSFDCVMQNIASARITGTELGAIWRHRDTRLDALVTLLDAVDSSSGQALSRRPAQQLNASASHRVGTLEYRAALLAMSARDNSAYDNRQLDAFVVGDLGIAWTPRKDLTLDARVENVGDVAYALAASSAGDYRMPDRAFHLGITWQP